MPLTKSGAKTLKAMRKSYGSKKGESVFYATMAKKKAGAKWHRKTG